MSRLHTRPVEKGGVTVATQFSAVLEMTKNSTEDKELVKSLEDFVNSKQISKTLFALRCRANMNQSDVAKKMNCSQGKVSKIENAGDTDLTIHDLVQYCSAVKMRLEIVFFPMANDHGRSGGTPLLQTQDIA